VLPPSSLFALITEAIRTSETSVYFNATDISELVTTSIILMMEAVSMSETMVYFYETTQCNILEHNHLEHLTVDNYQIFLMNKLPLLMENVPVETRHRILFQQNVVSPHFGCQVTTFLNQCYKNDWFAAMVHWLGQQSLGHP
jgi:hypothetical protein